MRIQRGMADFRMQILEYHVTELQMRICEANEILHLHFIYIYKKKKLFSC